MKPNYYQIIIGILACLMIIASCQSFDNESDQVLMVEVEVGINRPGIQTSSDSARHEINNTLLQSGVICVVSEEVTIGDLETLQWAIPCIDEELLDIVTNTVTLSIPIGESVKFIEIDVRDVFTSVDLLFSSEPDPVYVGISESVTIDSDTSELEVSIPLSGWSWAGTQLFGTSSLDVGEAMAQDSDGNIYFVGIVSGSLHEQTYAGGTDAILIKFNKYGIRQWTVQTGSSGNDSFSRIAIDSQGYIYVSGTWSQNDYDYVLNKYDSDGNEIWSEKSGVVNRDEAYGIAICENDFIYMTGFTNASGTDFHGETKTDATFARDAFIIKFDGSGSSATKVWNKLLTSTEANFDDAGTGIIIDPFSNDIYIIGATRSIMPLGSLSGSTTNVYEGSEDAFLAKYTNSGDFQWANQFGSPGEDLPKQLVMNGIGKVMITGTTRDSILGTHQGGRDIFWAQFDANGNGLMTEFYGQIGDASDDDVNGTVIDADGNYYFSGAINDGTTITAYLRKTDSDGAEIWAEQYGTATSQLGFTGLVVNEDGDIIVTGGTDLSIDGLTTDNLDIFIMKIEADDGSVR